MPYVVPKKTIHCAECGHNRHPEQFFTASKRKTKVCKVCRDKHNKKYALKGEATSLSAKPMTTTVTCEACGKKVTIREMVLHLKTHNHPLDNIPGIAPPDEYA